MWTRCANCLPRLPSRILLYLRVMFIVTPSTLLNAAALETRTVPKRMLGRIAVVPRRGAPLRVWLRLVFEMQLLRFLIPLTPFAAAMLIWPQLALPISQAPLIMLLVIGFVEVQVLSYKPSKRKMLLSEDEAARGLDALRFNARRVLTQIAVRRDVQQGELSLVVEQSELARVAPLTLVSLQRAAPKAEVMDLSPEDHADLHAGLFTGGLTERALHRISLSRNENLHQITLDVATISAHARMAARVARTGPAPEVPAA